MPPGTRAGGDKSAGWVPVDVRDAIVLATSEELHPSTPFPCLRGIRQEVHVPELEVEL